jgi:hypothetical protein
MKEPPTLAWRIHIGADFYNANPDTKGTCFCQAPGVPDRGTIMPDESGLAQPFPATLRYGTVLRDHADMQVSMECPSNLGAMREEGYRYMAKEDPTSHCGGCGARRCCSALALLLGRSIFGPDFISRGSLPKRSGGARPSDMCSCPAWSVSAAEALPAWPASAAAALPVWRPVSP